MGCFFFHLHTRQIKGVCVLYIFEASFDDFAVLPVNFEGICVAQTSVVSFGNLLLNAHLHFGFVRVIFVQLLSQIGGGKKK